jgi:nitric oxide reductase subunit B
MRENTVANMEHYREGTASFCWIRWAAATQRPNQAMSHVRNRPYKPLAGNTPTSTNFLWSVFSILFMIFGIGLLGSHHARQVSPEPLPTIPQRDPLTESRRHLR